MRGEDMQSDFELAGGSTIGRDHRRNRRNNQDAYCIVHKPNVTVAIVCDGCGDKQSSPHSEVGAHIGSRLIAETASRHAKRYLEAAVSLGGGDSPYFWERVRQDVLAMINVLANQMGESLSEVVSKYFLFTTVGVIITPQQVEFVSIGDGFMVINGHELRIGPFPENTPPYLCYSMVRSSIDPALLKFQIQQAMEPDNLQSFLLGTDGLGDLIKASGLKAPGTAYEVGPISQFWKGDAYFLNRFAVERRLAVINRDFQRVNLRDEKIDCESGFLPDDTTFVVGRRTR